MAVKRGKWKGKQNSGKFHNRPSEQVTSSKQVSGKKMLGSEHEKTALSKPGNFLYPIPAVFAAVRRRDGQSNILTIAWAGTVCSDPPMISISVRPSRYSYQLLKESGDFTVNLPTASLSRALDFCGVRSGRDTDKWKETGLTEGKALTVDAPIIRECPVSIECRTRQILPLGSHDLFLAEVTAVQVDKEYIDEKGAIHMERMDLLSYVHGQYFTIGEKTGSFGFSVRKK